MFKSASCWDTVVKPHVCHQENTCEGALPMPRLHLSIAQRLSHSYLHTADVNRQDSGEKQHLEEEVRHQAHNGKETELLE